ncbi:hypothetical protein ACEUZ9_000436 [Paracoccus litorisediminis]|uniref:ribonuclease toxin HepT-like protein n=1 Tax=Paracoccus litorisediminis TaxID=2006130 RepID=UPI003730FAAD
MIESSDPLFLRINAKLKRLEAEINSAQTDLLFSKKDMTNRLLVRSVAYAVHNAYNGIEQILEDVAQGVDGDKPVGGSMHSALLDQMSQDTGLRPAIVSEDDYPAYDDLRRFRHLFRHAYGVDLRADEIFNKFEIVRETILPNLKAALLTLRDCLEKTMEEPDPASKDGHGDLTPKN